MFTPGNGQPQQKWNYQWIVATGSSPTWSIVTDPAGNDVEYQIGGTDDAGNNTSTAITREMAYAGCGPHDTSSNRTCSGSSSLVKTTSYALSAVFSGGADLSTPSLPGPAYQPATTTITWPLGGGTDTVSKRVTTYSPTYNTCTFYTNFGEIAAGTTPLQDSTPNCYSINQPHSVAEYDFGTGSAGSLLRTTTTKYKWQEPNSPYLAVNLLNLPSSVVVTDGGTTAETDYGYDESGSPQGNLTSITRVNNVGPSPKTQSFFNTQGMPTSTNDPMGYTTSFTYDSTGAFLSLVTHPATNGVQHLDRYVFDFYTGLMMSHTDQNSQQTTYSYLSPSGVADPLNRLMKITYPATVDGTTGGTASGSKQFSYVDTVGSLSVTERDLQHTSGAAETHVTSFDGLGRVIDSQLTSDPSGAVTVATNYDARGRVYSVSNPYRGTNAGTTYYGYDPLGRKTLETEPDSNTQQWLYSGNKVTFTDEVGHS